MKNTNKIPPFPAEGQSVRFPMLERNAYLAIYAILAIVTIASVIVILRK